MRVFFTGCKYVALSFLRRSKIIAPSLYNVLCNIHLANKIIWKCSYKRYILPIRQFITKQK